MIEVLCIRHGEAEHNTLYKSIGLAAYQHPSVVDSTLTNYGIEQAKEINKQILNIPDIDVVFVSPLTRALQTCAEAIRNYPGVPVIVLDDLIEYPNTIDTPNKRKPVSILKEQYPSYDFSNITSNEELIWNKRVMETLEQCQVRVDKLVEHIKDKYSDKSKILIVGHSSWISLLLYRKDTVLSHCKIYKTVL